MHIFFSVWILLLLSMYKTVNSSALISFVATGAVSPPIRLPDQSEWVSRVNLTQTSDSIVLVLLMSVGQIAYEPCSEFSPICCLGLQLRDNVWGGDLPVLDEVRRICQKQGTDPWEDALAPLRSRQYVDVRFSVDDMCDSRRGSPTSDGLHSVTVLVLVLKRWSACEDKTVDTCLVHLQALEQTFLVDTLRTQQSAVVTLPVYCTENKPLNSLWFPSRSKCEWFCEPGFVRCVDSCQMLPQIGAALYSTMAVT